MRIRTVKPTFWKSETLASVSKETRLLAVALLNYADDEGYFMANEALIRGECFPFDDDSKSVRGGLQELSRIGYIALGNTPDGQRIGRVANFSDHQRVDKASPSKIKEKSVTWDDSTNPPRILPESSHTEKEVGRGKGREEKQGADGAPDQGPVFGDGLAHLMRCGESEKNARGFLGKLLRDWEAADVSDAITSAMASAKGDPKAYVLKILESKPRKAKLPPGSSGVLADLRAKFGARVCLRPEDQVFWDPSSQRTWKLDGTPRVVI